MLQARKGALPEISCTWWYHATEILKCNRKKEPLKKWLRYFTYDLQGSRVSNSRVGEVSNLFFEYASSDGIGDDYIVVELSSDIHDDGDCNIRQSFQYQNDPQRERILRNGIMADGRHFSLLGATNSGVQSQTYFFRCGSLSGNENLMTELLPGIRELEKSKGAPKRIKYQGLMFTSVDALDLPVSLHPNRGTMLDVDVAEIDSIQNENFDFTDGCGLISLKLARHLWNQLTVQGKKKTHEDSIPSVWQIRYAGNVKELNETCQGHICKGVLIVDTRNDSSFSMHFRRSMLKTTLSKECTKMLGCKIGIIGWSRASMGRISQQLLCLLTASVPDEVLEEIQQQHLDAIETATTKPMSAAWLAGLDSKPFAWKSFENMLLACAETGRGALRSDSIKLEASSTDESKSHHKLRRSYEKCTIALRHTRHLSDSLTKVQIPLASCRTLFGAAFPETLHDILKEGECVVMMEDGPLSSEYVILSRSPSYCPGDVRILKNLARNLSSNHPVSKMRNCILFSTAGKRPEADKMGGGDLDGDRYVVLWDKRLLKFKENIQQFTAVDYCPPAFERSNNDWIQHAALTDNVMLGVIENTFYSIAKQFGVNSSQAHHLNQLFQQLVDRNPAAIDAFDSLSKLAYNKARSQHGPDDLSGSMGNGGVLWERMLVKQKRLQSRAQHKIQFDDFGTFLHGLKHLADSPQTLERDMNRLDFHFNNCLQRSNSKKTTQKLHRILASSRPTHSHPLPSSPSSSSKVCNGTQEYKECILKFKTLVKESENIFAGPLDELHKEEDALLQAVKHQRKLENEAMMKFEMRGRIFVQKMAENEEELKQHKEKSSLEMHCLEMTLLDKKRRAKEKRDNETLCDRTKVDELEKSIKRISRDAGNLEKEIADNHWSITPSWLSRDKAQRVSALSKLEKEMCAMKKQRDECLTNIRRIEWECSSRIQSLDETYKSNRTKINSSLAEMETRVCERNEEICRQMDRHNQQSFLQMCIKVHAEVKFRKDEEELRLSKCQEQMMQAKSTFVQLDSDLRQMQIEEEKLDGICRGDELESINSLSNDIMSSELLQSGGIFQNQGSGTLLSEHAVTQIRSKIRQLNTQLQKIGGREDSWEEIQLAKRIASSKLSNDLQLIEAMGDNYFAVTMLLEKVKELHDCLQNSLRNVTASISDLGDKLRDEKLLREGRGNKNKNKKRQIEKKLAAARKKQGDFGNALGKCRSLFDACQTSLKNSSSDLESCFTYAEACSLIEIAERYRPSLDHVVDGMKKKLESMTKNQSDIASYKKYFSFARGLRGWLAEQQKHVMQTKKKAKNKLQDLRQCKIPEKEKEKQRSANRLKLFEEEVADSNKKISDLKKELADTFSPQELEQAEAEIEAGGAHEESIALGIGHIHHEFEQCCLESSKMIKDHGYDSYRVVDFGLVLLKRLKRVCFTEENYALGAKRKGTAKRVPLPVYAKRAELNKLMLESDCVIVTAGTGCGKSTQIPQYIASDAYTWMGESVTQNRGSRGFRLCCTQPRRLAAQSIAERVALEYQTQLGGKVGFQVGKRDGGRPEDSKKISDETEIEFVTEGWLLNQLKTSNDKIKNYDVVIIDEAHERNMETDLLLAHFRKYLRRLREDPQPEDIPLKVVVMSASIDWRKFCEYFDGAPRMDCPGRVFPVEEIYRPIDSEDYSFRVDEFGFEDTEASNADDSYSHEESVVNDSLFHFNSGAACDDQNDSLVKHAVEVLFCDVIQNKSDIDGDVLIFLSGSREILECVDSINQRAFKERAGAVAYPLYASMDQHSKNAAKDRSHRTGLDGEATKLGAIGHVRKVICCTNIAETSLTIDGVRFVLDGGQAKKLRYDHKLRAPTLCDEMVSQSSTKQRKGRAGRTQTGWCYYLYSERTHKYLMKDYDTPQIMQMPAEQLILYSMYNCGCQVEDLGLLDFPPCDVISIAKVRLEELGFVQFLDETRESLHLTGDGNIAGIMSSMQPESVRMVLWANEMAPMHRERVIKMATLLCLEDDIFFKKRSNDNESKEKKIEDKMITTGRTQKESELSCNSEEYAFEQEQKVHHFGDHFLALQEFEKFERKRPRTKSFLRVWCNKHGLNFPALSRAQQSVEQFHQVLKKRKKLSDQRDEGSLWTSDETVLRAMISGYFHQIVECLDPQLRDKFSLFHLLSSDGNIPVTVKLDRNSCVWQLVGEPERKLEFILDEGEEEVGGSLAEEGMQTKLSFLLYSRLHSIKPKKKKVVGSELIFMQGCSLIDPHWISEQAPTNWIDKVKFNPEKSSICREVLKNVGPGIISRLWKQDDICFFDMVKSNTGVKLIRTSRECCQISIIGSLAQVVRAKALVKEKVEELSSNIVQDRESTVFVRGIGEFGAGLELQKPYGGVDKFKGHCDGASSHGVFTDEAAKLPCRKPFRVDVRLQEKKLFVYINCDWDTSYFQPILQGIAGKFSNQADFLSLVPPNKGSSKFTFLMKARKGSARQNPENIPRKKILNEIKQEVSGAIMSRLNVLSADGLLPDDFAVLLALAREAHIRSKFWEKHFCKDRMIQFSPSFGCYEIFGSDTKSVKGRLDLLITGRLTFRVLDLAKLPEEVPTETDEMDGNSNNDTTLAAAFPKNHVFTRSELCRFSSLLENLRKNHPSVLFAADFCLTPSSVIDDFQMTNQLQSSDAGYRSCQSTVYSKQVQSLIFSSDRATPGLWLLSDYTRLINAHNERSQYGSVTELKISLYAFSPDAKEKASHCCRKVFSSFFYPHSSQPALSRELSGNAIDWNVCVMCRQSTTIFSSKGPDPGFEDTEFVQGFRLKVCGCTYCRECFRAAAHVEVETGDLVTCHNCKGQVLARGDCQAIMTPNFAAMKKDSSKEQLLNLYQREWTLLARESEQRYCKEVLVNSISVDGPVKCFDCGAHIVFAPNKSKRFVQCPTQCCPNKFCCNCHEVPVSEKNWKVCNAGTCQKKST